MCKSMTMRKKANNRGLDNGNRALEHFERVNLGSEKYWAAFFGPKQSELYQRGRCTSLTEALCTLKSMKMREKAKKGGLIGRVNRAF